MKREKRFLAAALCMVFIVFGAVWLIQTDGGRVSVKPFACVSAQGNLICGEIYRPAPISADSPGPAVVTCVGGNNAHSMMRDLNVELARAGYVVITYSSYKHGGSEIAETETMGAAEILQYVQTLSFVDQNRIGVMGHTRGSAYLFKAALGSGFVQAALSLDAVEIFGSLQGYTADTPINCGFVMSNYNEYLLEPRGYRTDEALLRVFAADAAIETGRLYGDVQKHTARLLYAVDTTDFAYPFSTGYARAALDFFSKTLAAQNFENTRAPVWPVLEGLGVLSLVGMTALLLALSQLLLGHMRLLQPRSAVPVCTAKGTLRSICHIVFALLTVAVPFLPLYMLGKRILEPTILFPQNDTNGLAIWAFFAGLIYCALLLILRTNRTQPLWNAGMPARPTEVLRTFIAAGAVFAGIYAVNLLGKNVFHAGFRLLCTCFEPLDMRRFLAGCTCFPVFLLYFLLSEAFRTERLFQNSGSGISEYIYGVLFYTGGFVLLYAINYLGFPLMGHSLFHASRFAFGPMTAMIPALPIIGIVSAWGHRKTGTIYFSAFLNTFLFTWLLVGTNAFYYT